MKKHKFRMFMTFIVWIGGAAGNLGCSINYLKVFAETGNWASEYNQDYSLLEYNAM
jgi:hypothetical protein